jgi:hypothetical protein
MSTPDRSHLLDLPSSSLAVAARTLVNDCEPPAIARHSVRSYLFARLLAGQRRLDAHRDYDDELLFASCVLHDLGLSDRGDGDQRFEVDGADAAASFLTAGGLPAARVDQVWEAIALHTSPGIADRRGALCWLTRSGIGMDFGRGVEDVSESDAAAIHAAYPRGSMATALVDAITRQALAKPTKAPPYSLADALVRERSEPPHISRMESATAASRWGG